MAFVLLVLCVVLARVATATYTCEDYGVTCDPYSITPPRDRAMCLGLCNTTTNTSISLIIPPGTRFKFGNTLFGQTDEVTGDTYLYSDDGTHQVRQLTIHKNAIYVGSAPPPVGSPVKGLIVTGDKMSGTTADKVWARESRISIASPTTGEVIGYQEYVYLAGQQTKRGFLFQLSDDTAARVVFTGNQLIVGDVPLNMILQNAEASVIATGDVVVERATYPKSHVACMDIPVTGITNVLIMKQYTVSSTCAVVVPVHTFTTRLEIDTAACYALNEYAILRALLQPVLGANDYFKIPNGCANINPNDPQLTLYVYTDNTCTQVHTTDTINIDLGVCISKGGTQSFIACQNEVFG